MNKKIKKCIITDPKWTDYVMSLFDEKELINGNPTHDGLMRLVEKLIGRIVKISNHLAQDPHKDNAYRACVISEIYIYPHEAAQKRGDDSDPSWDREISFTGIADACPSNCQHDFASFPTAMAETRAESRAFRKALRLRNTVASEELGVDNNTIGKIEEGKIKPIQITALKIMADRLGINLDKAKNYYLKNESPIEELTNAEAQILINNLNKLQEGEKGEEIPSGIISKRVK